MPIVQHGEPTRGSEALSAKCPGRGDQQRMAEKYGFDPGQFSRWCRALRKPETPARVILFEKEKIGLSWWDEPAIQAEELAPESGRPSAEPSERAS